MVSKRLKEGVLLSNALVECLRKGSEVCAGRPRIVQHRLLALLLPAAHYRWMHDHGFTKGIRIDQPIGELLPDLPAVRVAHPQEGSVAPSRPAPVPRTGWGDEICLRGLLGDAAVHTGRHLAARGRGTPNTPVAGECDGRST